MSTRVYHTHIRPRMIRPSRFYPRWGIKKTARELVQSENKRVLVGLNGLYVDSPKDSKDDSQKIPWSRLTAYQLRKLGVEEIHFDEKNDTLQLLKEVTRTIDIASFVGREACADVVNLNTMVGQITYIRHPLADRSRIRSILNSFETVPRVAEAAFERLKESKDSEMLRWALNNLMGLPILKAAFAALKEVEVEPEIYLKGIWDRTLVTLVHELEPRDYPYVTESFKKSLSGLINGQEEGMKLVNALKKMGESEASEVSHYLRRRETRIEMEERKKEQQDDDDFDPEDYRGTGGTPPYRSGF